MKSSLDIIPTYILIKKLKTGDVRENQLIATFNAEAGEGPVTAIKHFKEHVIDHHLEGSFVVAVMLEKSGFATKPAIAVMDMEDEL